MLNLLVLLHYAIWLYMMLVIGRVLLSWVSPDPYNPVVRFLRQMTDPALHFIRRRVPILRTTLDFSPIILLVGLTLCDNFLMKSIRDVSMGMSVHVTANLLYAIVIAIHDILRLYMIIVIIRAVISWVNPDPYNFLVRFLYDITEPVLYRVRRLLPVAMGGIDFSPMVVIFLIYAIDSFLMQLVLQNALR